MITIVGGGNLNEEKGMTVAAKEIIDGGKTVIYQSSRQRCCPMGAKTLDSIFEQAEDFDDFAAKASQFIGENDGDTVFVAIGDGVNNNVSIALCRNYGNVEIIEGHLCDCVASAVKLGKLSFDRICYIDAYDYLGKATDTGRDTVITGLDDRLLFWDIKARLLDYYPEDTQVFINKTSVLLEDADYKEPCDIFLPRLDIMEKKRYSYEDLMDIVRELRQKCPWDREQTHKSIRTNLIEECYELYEAIDKDDSDMMLEEMGDVLLQICLHNIFECEHGDVREDDVTTLIAQKLIRRHPHVYGQDLCRTKAEVKNGWDEIKKQEYSLKSKGDELRHISRYLPPLMRAYKTVKKAKKFGVQPVGDMDRLAEDIKAGKDVKNNCGRLLLLAVDLILSAEEHPYTCLTETVDSFIDRIDFMDKNGQLTNEYTAIDINAVNTH